MRPVRRKSLAVHPRTGSTETMKRLALALLPLLFPLTAAAREDTFDVHVHVEDGEASIRAYLAQAQASKRDLARLGGMLMAKAGEPARTRQRNDDLIRLVSKYPRMLPIASVHPHDGDAALAEIDRLAALGIRAIKIHPLTQGFDVTDPRVSALCERAGEAGIVVMIDNAGIIPGDNEKLLNLAVRNSKTRFLFTHIGGMNFRYWNLIALLRTAKGYFYDNIYFDVSATVTLVADSPLEGEFIWTLRNIGIDRITLGSDYPQISLDQSLDALAKLDIGEEERTKIRSVNASILFGAEQD
ncbi:amidohydrolase family protein [Sphingosinicella sp.]|uniref:amidohydrolase family protein n=1 Tax=Sphingosinicella sp. TaxID=1917971 RepID=UPI0025D2A61F|nr:amidohydrolase family protein [Sphingosinicella sp.]